MTASVLVEMFSKEDCHLCDIARAVIMEAKEKYPFEYAEKKIEPGMEEYEKYNQQIPVVMVNKKFAFKYRLTKEDLIRKLNEASAR